MAGRMAEIKGAVRTKNAEVIAGKPRLDPTSSLLNGHVVACSKTHSEKGPITGRRSSEFHLRVKKVRGKQSLLSGAVHQIRAFIRVR